MHPPLANVITLGVQDLRTQLEFYRRLGFEQVFEEEDFAAFELRGAILCLFPAEKLAADARADIEPRGTGIRVSLGILAETAEEVDAIATRVREAGGRITKEPVDAEFFNGRSCYFADPESNYWEIVFSANRDGAVIRAALRAAGLLRD
jgi:predicted lactoylglutathione lyase